MKLNPARRRCRLAQMCDTMQVRIRFRSRVVRDRAQREAGLDMRVVEEGGWFAV